MCDILIRLPICVSIGLKLSLTIGYFLDNEGFIGSLGLLTFKFFSKFFGRTYHYMGREILRIYFYNV